jgi:hypothetical protein
MDQAETDFAVSNRLCRTCQRLRSSCRQSCAKQIISASDSKDKTLRLQGGRLEAKMFAMKDEAGGPRWAPLRLAIPPRLYSGKFVYDRCTEDRFRF